MTVLINGVDKQGVYVNGVQVKQALDAANETVNKGVYDATTLSTVDAELATANIKNGITIFGFAGSANVFDISDATAIAAEVIVDETFYAVSGGIRTGTMPIVALNAAANAYPTGYHAGAASLTAVDAQLVTGSIKYGITIFGVAGHTNVRDVSDANALVGEVKNGRTFFAVGGAIKTGTMPTVAITAANDNYLAGYHAGNVGGLAAIDVNLAAANIRSGVNIFGFVGPATVQDISAADAAVGDVKDPKTFFSATGGIRTGTMPTVALAPGSNAYPTGYHVGAANLTAVDADLATANIKNGITIFNINGSVDVRDVSDANALVGEVKNGRTFFAVGGAIKTGTMPTKAIVAANDLYEGGYHAGNPGGLDAIDTDLTGANIKYGKTIFGKAGSTNVRDTTDANATAIRVRTGYTFYAGGGARKTGTLATKTLSPLNDTVAAGYYAATTLSTVDADLTATKIKSGITIFGKLGTFTNTGSPPAAGDVKNGKVCWANGTQITGTMPTVAITAANDNYPAGYHAGNAGGLDAIDTDLASANIKYGITIFGKAGSTNVRDSTDANLTAAEAPTGKTFYAGGGARKTGTGTKTLNPANETVAAGYYAATTLSTVDVHLAAANIKEGVTIFGFLGTLVEGVDVSDANALVGEVKAGRTFYSVAAPRKTGTLPTRTLSPANDTVAAGYYAATTLSTVDGNLAPANIKKDVNIFGKVGTYEEAVEATVALFQAIPAYEVRIVLTTVLTAYCINDNNTGTRSRFQDEDAAAQVTFGKLVKIKRWRHFGADDMTGDGRWKIQYWHISNQAWTDWVTDIPVRTVESWSGFSTEAEVTTIAIRLICTNLDDFGDNQLYELEVIY